ncbi:glycoside hydrolase family 99-like domain-containing protein [Aestuariivirga litoralis]|uniref:glycoside hydrolase family 99-like domain-containing protein n=1 Tax=Aestuariivirga litoralis TaxID=2650924 RepID=UPI00137A88BE|nr:glycoside hydrolase family 99-like domain-containing protein [Aestuariivirga litoralis]
MAKISSRGPQEGLPNPVTRLAESSSIERETPVSSRQKEYADLSDALMSRRAELERVEAELLELRQSRVRQTIPIWQRLINRIRTALGWPAAAENMMSRGESPTQPVTGRNSLDYQVLEFMRYDTRIERIEFSTVSDGFVPHAYGSRDVTSPRAIAFYLPQFHPFPENDLWWGKGFTEWTNVGKAKPLFQGHHQPHCPIHLGYYDLRIPEVMEEQARLAREYLISGFAYYFYWFDRKVLMEKPLRQMLENENVDIPFCMIWANENWTRRWDGQEDAVLIAQKHSHEDSRALLEYLRPYFESKRYIKVDGKPVLVVYRTDIIPAMAETAAMWREQAKEFGFPGLYLISAQTFGQRDPRRYGFDAALEFPPHTAASRDITEKMEDLDPRFTGTIYSYDDVVTNAVMRPRDDFKVLPTAMLSWDNTPRKGSRGTVFAGFSASRYAQWLSANAERVAKDSSLSAEEKLIFVNAWNEWAEGAHLEPDQRHGYGYLEATRQVLSNYTTEAAHYLAPPIPSHRRSDIALIFHLHYEEAWPDLLLAHQRLERHEPDVFVTVTSLALAKLVSNCIPTAMIEIVDNRGRDIRPFLMTYARIAQLGYRAVGKFHGKLSVYREDGPELRTKLIEDLASDTALNVLLTRPQLGLLTARGALIDHSDKNLTFSGDLTSRVANGLGLKNWKGTFPAGSMFWFRPEALTPLLSLNSDMFDIERGLVDGTLAHAIERLFCAVCKASSYEVDSVGAPRPPSPD